MGREIDKLVRKREEHHCRSNVKERMDHCNSDYSCLFIHNREMQEGIQCIKDYHEHRSSDHIEV